MPTMPERLTSLETEFRYLRDDVITIKADVKLLVRDRDRNLWKSALLKGIPWAALITAVAALLVR